LGAYAPLLEGKPYRSAARVQDRLFCPTIFSSPKSGVSQQRSRPTIRWVGVHFKRGSDPNLSFRSLPPQDLVHFRLQSMKLSSGKFCFERRKGMGTIRNGGVRPTQPCHSVTTNSTSNCASSAGQALCTLSQMRQLYAMEMVTRHYWIATTLHQMWHLVNSTV
jgi:hypothetical protein